MTKPYIEQIEALIAEHEKAIASLTIAHGVLLQLEAAAPKVNKSGSSAKQSTQKPKPKAKEERGYVAKVIMAAVNRLGVPSTSKAIWQEVKVEAPDMPQKRVWNTLYILVAKGSLFKDGNIYGVPVKDEKAA